MTKKSSYFMYLVLMLAGCGIPNQSVMKGTYGEESFTLIGKVDMLSRHAKWIDCAQAVSFYPAYPVGDQLGFTFGFKDKDMYQGFQEQLNQNILFKVKNQMDDFYVLGYTNKPIEIYIGDAPEGDFFIIEQVELLGKRFNSTFEELGKAVVIEGKMKFHFDEILLESDFEFVLGQCYP